MFENPSTSGHGYFDLDAIEKGVYFSHPPVTPGVGPATDRWRAVRRANGLFLDGRLDELRREIRAVQEKLEAAGLPRACDAFIPHARGSARPQTLVPLRSLNEAVPASSRGVALRLEAVTSERRTEGALRGELERLQGQRARLLKVAAALHRLDSTGQLLAVWRSMETPVKSPGGWFGLLDAEERIYKSLGSAQSPRSELTLGKWRSTRRNQGMLLDGRLTELNREIAKTDRELAQLERVSSHSGRRGHEHEGEDASADRSLGHEYEMGWTAARRYRDSDRGRASAAGW
ncbi:hypothetical protein DMC30DRAFT_390298 [Rhodotorula diobovata]|uniref:Uncharacterized protein n=1 Tax=Rhodotorula diobovata TaxID=5288 RepID=A0A5C5G3E8_9BASI|nr:hypothetical protein DMC30DRAFT_390298 [Rhodotorula diobovata]